MKPVHVTNTQEIYTHTNTAGCASSGGSEAFEKPLEDEDTTKSRRPARDGQENTNWPAAEIKI